MKQDGVSSEMMVLETKRARMWRFRAEAFNKSGSFLLWPEIPFVGTRAAAYAEGEKRKEAWEEKHQDFICRCEVTEWIAKRRGG